MSRTRKRKKNYGKKIMLTFLVICMSVIMGGGLFAYRIMNKIIDPQDVISDKDEDKTTDNTKNNEKDDKEIVIEDKKHITNILLIGTDNRKDGEGERADAIIIFTMDEKNNDMRLTSIMRDSYVTIPASKGRAESKEKINHSYAYGGVRLLMDTIETNFELKIDKYVKIDFSGFKNIVAELGGVDVNITSREELNELNRCLLLDIYDNPKKKKLVRFRDLLEEKQLLQARDEGAKYKIENNPELSEDDFNYIADIADFKYQTGYTHLDGRQTLAYSRMRHSTGGSSGRTSRQREVIDLLLDKLPNISPLKYFPLAERTSDYIKTNMGIDEIVGFAKKALSINNFQLKQLQIPPENLTEGRLYIGFNYSFVFLMDIPQVTEVLHKFIFDDMEYNPKFYKDFNYRNSNYYIEPPVKEEKAEEEDEEKGEKDENEDSSETDSQKEDKSEVDTPTNDNTEENTDTPTDEEPEKEPEKEPTEEETPTDVEKPEEETSTETETPDEETSTETKETGGEETTETTQEEINEPDSQNQENTDEGSEEESEEDDFDLE